MPYHATIKKYAGEKYPIGFTFVSPDLASGETITGVETTITPNGGGSNLAKVGSPTINGDGNAVQQVVEAGVAGTDYTVKFEVTTSLSYKHDAFFRVKVVEDE